MAQSTHTYAETVPHPIDAVWAAMHRTVDLDLQGGQEISERISDSEWTTKLQNRTTRCTTAFDEEDHVATVTMKVDIRRSSDTTVLTAQEVEGGTQVSVAFTMNANIVLLKLSELIGSGAYERIAHAAIGNIVAICEGRATRIQTQEQLDAYAHARLKELDIDQEPGR